jgi:hypothetical protein
MAAKEAQKQKAIVKNYTIRKGVRIPAWNCMEPHARFLWNRLAVLRRTMQRLPVYSRIASEASH